MFQLDKPTNSFSLELMEVGVCRVELKGSETQHTSRAFLPRVGFQLLSRLLLPSGNALPKGSGTEQQNGSFSPILSLFMWGDLGAKKGEDWS